MNAEYDISKLTTQISGMNAALLGAGATDGDLQNLLRVETGQLHADIAKSLGPKTKAAADERVLKDVKGVFFPIFPEVNLFGGAQRGSSADFQWLFASKKGPGWLLGADSEDVMPGLDGGSMAEIYSRANHKRGAAWRDMGEHSHVTMDAKGKLRQHYKAARTGQHAIKMNRIVVKKHAFDALVKTIQNKSGELRAAFYAVARHYAPKVVVPGWIASKMETALAKGKASYRDMLTPDNPQAFIESTFKAPGLESNPRLQRKIQGAMDKRAKIVFTKLKQVISGYKYNFETGQAFKPKPPTMMEAMGDSE
jgi:hypothetical protein